MVPRGGRATSGRNAARGRGRGRGAAAGAPADEPPVDAEPDDDIDYALHPIGIIVASHDPPKDIRFSISRDLFKSYPAATFDALPARMTGVIDQWVRKAEGKLNADRENVRGRKPWHGVLERKKGVITTTTCGRHRLLC